MREWGPAPGRDGKSAGRKWVRYERAYSNSMWHAGYKRLDGVGWFIAYQDDAARFITGYGVFGEATGGHAVEVLAGAVAEHGRPASIMTRRGSQFYAGEAEAREGGSSEFERELARRGIRQVLCGAGHPQTNGKLARFHGEIQGKLRLFSGIDEFVRWYNHVRPHDSLDRDTLETPARAFVRKMPKGGEGQG